MKLTYSKKIIILSAVLFLLVLVADIIFANLLLGSITSINDKVKQLVISSQEREKELNLKDSVLNSEANRMSLEQYFVGAGNAKTADFITYLESLAKTNGLTAVVKGLDSTSVVGLTSADTVTAIHLRLNVVGKWGNVFSFLQALEGLPKVLSINSVFLASASDKTWSLDVDFSVAQLKN